MTSTSAGAWLRSSAADASTCSLFPRQRRPRISPTSAPSTIAWFTLTMPRARSSWKQYERVVMSALGGRRIPVTGRAGPGGDPGDGELPGHYVEIRDHARPRPIRWFREVAAEARSRGVIPLLIFKGPSSALSPLVLLRLHDLEEVIHRGGSTRGAGPDPAGQGAAPGTSAGAGGGQGPDARWRAVAALPGLDDPGSHLRPAR